MRAETELTTRLCYVNFDGSEALAASRKLGLQCLLDDSFVNTYATPVYDGIQVIFLHFKIHKFAAITFPKSH